MDFVFDTKCFYKILWQVGVKKAEKMEIKIFIEFRKFDHETCDFASG